MTKKLGRAVKAWAGYSSKAGFWWAYAFEMMDTQPCYIVPAAEYERLTRKSTKAAKRGRRGK